MTRRRRARRRSPIRSRSRRPTASCASGRIDKKLVMPDANLHFPKGDVTRYVAELERRRALRRHAGRAGRHQALGLQRSAEAHGQVSRTIRRRRPSIANSAPASWNCIRYPRAERPHQRRRQCHHGAEDGDHRRAQGNVDGGEGQSSGTPAPTTIRWASASRR